MHRMPQFEQLLPQKLTTRLREFSVSVANTTLIFPCTLYSEQPLDEEPMTSNCWSAFNTAPPLVYLLYKASTA
jgi:hypothetical protein